MAETIRLICILLCCAFPLDWALMPFAIPFLRFCQARGRQDVEMRIRIPSALCGLGCGIICVILDALPVAIALFKPIEAIICISFALSALGKESACQNWHRGDARPCPPDESWPCLLPAWQSAQCFYNKGQCHLSQKYGGNAEVAGFGVAWGDC